MDVVYLDEPVFMLTTIDNPYNPFTNFDEWNAWDISHGWHFEEGGIIANGYCSNQLLANIAVDSPDISYAQSGRAVNDAIDEIVKNNLTGMHIKVDESYFTNRKK